MPRKQVDPEIVDVEEFYEDWVRELPHVHSPNGDCMKNAYGPRCGATGVRTKVFNGGL